MRLAIKNSNDNGRSLCAGGNKWAGGLSSLEQGVCSTLNEGLLKAVYEGRGKNAQYNFLNAKQHR
jgi:hypothetical protein